jgi:hypothetical protein
MNPLIHNDVRVGMVRRADRMSRSSSAPSIGNGAWVQGMKSG